MSETTKVMCARCGIADDSVVHVFGEYAHMDMAMCARALRTELDAALAWPRKEAEGMARKAVEDFGDLVAGRASLKDIAVRNGALNASVETEIGPVIASLVITMLGDADNYVEMRVRDPQTLKEYVVTALRGEGKTPHELRREAEARVAALTAERDALEGAVVEFNNLLSDSRGVIGYHLNGDELPWDDALAYMPHMTAAMAKLATLPTTEAHHE